MKKILYILDLNLEDSAKVNLGLHLRSYGFTLVPISKKDLNHFIGKGQKTIICLSNSLQSIKEVAELKRRFFKIALLNKKINLIEFSYFLGKDSIWGQMRNYHCYGLPSDYIKISEQISKSYHEFLKVNSKWPGGRRSKLSIKNLL